MIEERCTWIGLDEHAVVVQTGKRWMDEHYMVSSCESVQCCKVGSEESVAEVITLVVGHETDANGTEF